MPVLHSDAQIEAIVHSAFKPLRVAVAISDYKQKMSFIVLDKEQAVIAELKDLDLRYVRHDEKLGVLGSHLARVREEIERKEPFLRWTVTPYNFDAIVADAKSVS